MAKTKTERKPKNVYHTEKMKYHMERLQALGYKVTVKITEPKK